MSPTSEPEGEAAQSPWPPAEFVLPLRKPVQDDDGGLIKQLALREPTDDEWTKFFTHPAEVRRRHAISIITGIRPGVIAKVAIGDVLQAEAYLWAFFEVGQAIAAWSPPSSPSSTAGAQPTSES